MITVLSKDTYLLCVRYFLSRLQEGYSLSSVDDISVSLNGGILIYNIKVDIDDCDNNWATSLMEKVRIYFSRVSLNHHWVGIKVIDGNADMFINHIRYTKSYIKSTFSEVSLVLTQTADTVDDVDLNKRVTKLLVGKRPLEGLYYELYNSLAYTISSYFKEYVISYKGGDGNTHKDVVEGISSDDAFDVFRRKYKAYKEGVDYTFIEAFKQGDFNDVTEILDPEPKMIWSDSLDENVVAGFTIEDEVDGTKHYTWNDDDCVYYWDEADDDYYMEVPMGAKVDV